MQYITVTRHINNDLKYCIQISSSSLFSMHHVSTLVRILLASAVSSILARWPNSMSLLFCMIAVRGGCSVIRLTSRLETRWYQRISRILLRHHWSSASIFLASVLDRAQHSDPYSIIGKMQMLYSFSLVPRESRDFQMQLSDFCITLRVRPLRWWISYGYK